MATLVAVTLTAVVVGISSEKYCFSFCADARHCCCCNAKNLSEKEEKRETGRNSADLREMHFKFKEDPLRLLQESLSIVDGGKNEGKIFSERTQTHTHTDVHSRYSGLKENL